MHPVLIEIGRLRIYSYGFMLAASFWIGILLAARRARARGVDPVRIYDLSIILILAAVVGSRVLYILTHRSDYRSVLDVVALWQGGATFYGGFALALAGAVVYLRRSKLSFLLVADICAPSIALGESLTRIGCFLSGCCFGAPTGSALGVVFPPDCPAGYHAHGVALHPTQLYSSVFTLALAVALLLADRRRPFTGFTFSLLCVLYGAGRFTIDIFRYYEPSSRIAGGLAVSQAASVALAAAGAILFAVLRRRRSARG
jgi:phosphatidylglycerol:prolipoprotein diacylglycerol transferase